LIDDKITKNHFNKIKIKIYEIKRGKECGILKELKGRGNNLF